MGCLLIKDLFHRRGQHKKHIDSSTSNLYELSNRIEIYEIDVENVKIPVVELPESEKDTFDKLNEIIEKEDFDIIFKDLYAKDWFMHDVFVITNEKPISQLSKETTINRKYLTDCRKEAQYYLKTQLINRI